MNISQMKNMLILKDLPSNIVDEAIVILKNNSKVKNKELIENKEGEHFRESQEENPDFIIKEAEYIIEDYIKKLEQPEKLKSNQKDINLKYKKLQITSFFLGITTIIGLIISILK